METLVVAGIYATTLACGPILVLGWLEQLRPAPLALGTLVLSGAVAGYGAQRGGLPTARGHLRACAHGLARAFTSVDTRFVATLGVVPVGVILIWTALLSYLAPPSGWDGLWYHDPIVGFTIQNHGFKWVDVPSKLNLVNGYPKTSEMLSLWFAIFSGRTLVELPNTLLSPLLIASTYLSMRRLAAERAGALAVSLVFFLLPAVALQLRSTYVDVTFITFVAATLALLVRPTVRPRDALPIGLGLGLMMGMKSTGMLLAPLLLGLLLCRTLAFRRSSFPNIITPFVAGTLMLALGSGYYVRNGLRTGNPLWPATLTIEGLGIDWEGPVRFDEHQGRTGQRIRDIIAWPDSTQTYYPDVRKHSYGPVLPWSGPLAFAGVLILLWRCVRDPDRRARRTSKLALGTAATLMATVVVSPAWWWARLNLHAVLGYLILLAVVLSRLPYRSTVCAGIVLIAAAAIYPLRSAWGVPTQTALELARQSPLERATFRLTPQLPAQTVALARERELVAGSTVAIINHYTFPGPLWNERYTNRIAYAKWKGTKAFLSRLEALGTRWVTVKSGSKQQRAIRKDKGKWQRVGTVSQGHLAYRRTH